MLESFQNGLDNETEINFAEGFDTVGWRAVMDGFKISPN